MRPLLLVRLFAGPESTSHHDGVDDADDRRGQQDQGGPRESPQHHDCHERQGAEQSAGRGHRQSQAQGAARANGLTPASVSPQSTHARRVPDSARVTRRREPALDPDHPTEPVAPSCGPTVTKADGTPWTCTFVDDFRGTQLDTTKWSEVTTATSGFSYGDCFIGGSDNVAVANGTLRLMTRREAQPTTCEGFSVPDEPWHYGAWPTSGEIHIAEFYSPLAHVSPRSVTWGFVLGAGSATTIRRRRDEWITAGIFKQLEQICLEAYDRIVGLDLDDVAVDGCIVKAPCGGEADGKSPVDRGKLLRR